MAFAIIASLIGQAAASDLQRMYAKKIGVPQKLRPVLQDAVEDLESTLHRMTGESFATDTEIPKRGIVIRRMDELGAPPAAKKSLSTGNTEAFCIWPDGDARLWIIARTDLGLSHGVYRYLELLGCRWYFPSERWTIIPTRKDIRLTEMFTAAPAFRSRMFSGTGGFGGNLPLDPTRRLQGRWMQWQRRNRFGGEFQVSGHTGEAFNVKHRDQLEAHPEWRAMIDGKRVPWSLTAKFCAGNKEVVDLYVKDRLDFYRQARKHDLESPRAWAVSVEPADGGGHCSCPRCLAIGAVSDRVFHVANQVANAVRREFPNGRVSLFAYNQHAAAPTIALQPNVYVQAIPYAFQRTGLNPDQLLDAWSQKVPRMGVYDYWSIPDWSHDLPTFDPLVFGPQRLRGWNRRGVDSFLCESTYSSGAMGLAWGIGSRIAWQPDADVEALTEAFIRDCFGPSSEPMRRMLQRWSRGFFLTSHELALSYRDIKEAWQIVEKDDAMQPFAQRVADYGRYVHYLRLRFDYLQTKRSSAERREAAEQLMRYSWSIYESSMIHAFRLSQLLARDERIAGDESLSKTYDWRNAQAPGWKLIRPKSDSEIRTLVDQGAKKLKPQAFVNRQFEGPLIPIVRQPAPLPAGHVEPIIWLNNSLEFQVQSDRAGLELELRIATEKPVRLLVSGPDGKQAADQSVVTGEKWRSACSTARVTLPDPGLYNVQIVSQKRMFRLMIPANVRLSIPGWSNSQGTPTPRLYFYVPRETKQLAIYANYTAAGPPRFFQPDGAQAAPKLVDQGHLILLPIPPEHRGRVWSLDRAKCPIGPLKMLNAPAAFALSAETLLVPRDALNSHQP